MEVRPILPPDPYPVATHSCRDQFPVETHLSHYRDRFPAVTLTCRDPFPVETHLSRYRDPFPAAIRSCPDRFRAAIPSFRVPSLAATQSEAKAALKSSNETRNSVDCSLSGSV